MTFRRLARNNVRGNWHRYVAFFLCSTFSVMIFFIYAAFLFHPDVVSGNIPAASKVRQGMILCEYIIVIFSFFFVLYSMSAFLRSRKKEFGLLRLFGTTNRQIALLVVYENTLIALLAIAAGIGFGALFTKLFFMVLAQLLQVTSPIRFILAPKAIWITALGFLALFELITLYTLRHLGRSQIVELMKASKQPKSLPLYSKWLTALAAVCLLSGYYMAYTAHIYTIIAYMMPILITVIVGTYFLFTQASVAILRRLQRTPGLYYRHTHIVTIAQLLFKIKDNARTLFTASILCAVILTASGTFYVLFQDTRNQMTERFPQSFGVIEKGLGVHEVIHPEELKRQLALHGLELDYEVQLSGFQVPVTLGSMGYKTEALVIPEQSYNRVAKLQRKKTLKVEPDHAYYVHPNRQVAVEYFKPGDKLETVVGGKNVTLQIDGQSNGGIINSRLELANMIVVNDRQYEEWSRTVPEPELYAYYGFEVRNWKDSLAAASHIRESVPKERSWQLECRIEDYAAMHQFNSLALFIGVFVSFLFFIASGSMLYFKLFTEIQEDQTQFRALSRIGVSDSEIRKITTTQIGISFFVPVVVGMVHAAFAYKTLGNLLGSSVWQYGIDVMAVYTGMQILYFALARKAYMKQLAQS